MTLVIDGVETQFPRDAVVTRKADGAVRKIESSNGSLLWSDAAGSFESVFGKSSVAPLGSADIEILEPRPQPIPEPENPGVMTRKCLDCEKWISSGILCMSCSGKRGARAKAQKKQEALEKQKSVDNGDNNGTHDAYAIPAQVVKTGDFSGVKNPDSVSDMKQTSEHTTETTPDNTVRYTEQKENFPEEKNVQTVPHEVHRDGIKTLPNGVVSALKIVLSNAGYQAMQENNQRLTDYMQGVSFGVGSAAAIICGALGYDAGFLLGEESEEKNATEKPSSN